MTGTLKIVSLESVISEPMWTGDHDHRNLRTVVDACEAAGVTVEYKPIGRLEDGRSMIVPNDRVLVVGAWLWQPPEVYAAVERELAKAAKIAFLQDDFMYGPNTAVKKAVAAGGGREGRQIWTHYSPDELPLHLSRFRWAIDWTPGGVPDTGRHSGIRTVNWNVLKMRDPLPTIRPDNEGIIYWGTFREDRADKLRLYLDVSQKNRYPVTISCRSKKGRQQFEWLAPRADMLEGAMEVPAELRSWPATVFMCNWGGALPNRFYESLEAGLAMFIDAEHVDWIGRYGHHVPSFMVVGNSEDVAKKLRTGQAQYVQNEQRALWVPQALRMRDEQRAVLRHIIEEYVG